MVLSLSLAAGANGTWSEMVPGGFDVHFGPYPSLLSIPRLEHALSCGWTEGETSVGVTWLSVSILLQVIPSRYLPGDEAEVLSIHQITFVGYTISKVLGWVKEINPWLLPALVMIIPLFTTYIATSIQARWALRSSSCRKSPPVSPYWLPFVGNLVAYFSDGPDLVARLMYVLPSPTDNCLNVIGKTSTCLVAWYLSSSAKSS